MTTLYVVTGGTGFSLSTGGTGDQTLTAADDVVLDGNSPNWTLTGDLGTVANTVGDYSASTAGCLSITATVAFTNIFDLDTYDAVIGADGFDASAASGATIQMGSGVIVSQGDFLVHASATLTEETATLVMDGGTVGTPLVLAASVRARLCRVCKPHSGKREKFGKRADWRKKC